MTISVAMTTYNGAAFLCEQLDSIFAQTRLPDELIVCDDGSTDATLELLRGYSARAPFRMTVVLNEQRRGSTKNFEQAIQLCTGDIIALSDQDDVWYPSKLEAIEQRFESDTGVGLVFTNGDLIDEHGRLLPKNMWKAFRFGPQIQKMLSGPRAFDILLSWPFVTGATAAFCARFRNLLLPIPVEAPTFVHDRWIAVLIGAVGRIGLIHERYIAYRLHSYQQIGVGKPLLARLVTPYRTSSDQIALAAMHERLTRNPSWTAKPGFLRALHIRERHVDVRTAFPGDAIGRLKGVALEYASGRYSRYPMPVAHALRDLLAGTQ
jgi:glycosyltransferase involved in cell wall biosynthesis